MRMKMRTLTAMGALVLSAAVLSATAAPAADSKGFIYGKVTTRSGGTYQGILRWGGEEAFWDDHFNSLKDERKYMDYQPRDERGRREPIRLFGIRIGVRWDDYDPSKVFSCRFADIDRIEVEGDSEALVTMRSGSEYFVSGYANDVDATITVYDQDIGDIDIKWAKIETVEFMDTPDGLPVPGDRLHGTVTTEFGDYTGFIQWDSDECLSIDELDGDSQDGDVSIKFEKIRSIERRGNRSRVELKDGRKLVLDGSNDVDSSIRGILVEDPRFGRVEVTWDTFEKAVFDDPRGSGRGRNEFPKQVALRATVLDLDGDTFQGPIVFDLDESESWEHLNGEDSGVDFNVPFEMVQSVQPRSRRSAQITLRNGEELRLDNGQDVTADNDGVLIFARGVDEDPEYVRWRDVDRIDFEW